MAWRKNSTKGFYFSQLRYLLLNPILKIKLQYCGNTAYGLLRVLYLKQEKFYFPDSCQSMSNREKYWNSCVYPSLKKKKRFLCFASLIIRKWMVHCYCLFECKIICFNPLGRLCPKNDIKRGYFEYKI